MSDLVIIPNAPEICNKTAVQNCHVCPDFNCGDNMVSKSDRAFYTAGLAEGIRRARGAVEKKLSIYNDNEFGGAWEVNHGLKTALAAIDAVEGE